MRFTLENFDVYLIFYNFARLGIQKCIVFQ